MNPKQDGSFLCFQVTPGIPECCLGARFGMSEERVVQEQLRRHATWPGPQDNNSNSLLSSLNEPNRKKIPQQDNIHCTAISVGNVFLMAIYDWNVFGYGFLVEIVTTLISGVLNWQLFVDY